MIWLLRHADAALGIPDEDRPLTERGQQEARTVGSALTKLGVALDACLTSPRLRARTTAELACEPLGVAVQVEQELSTSPFDAAELAIGHGAQVLLVAHNPGISMAVGELTGARVDMPKAGLACVDRGKLVALLGPAQLAAIAG